MAWHLGQHARPVVIAALVSLACANCESGEEKCRKARAAASAAWAEYVAALEHARKRAHATEVEANDRLSGDIEQRLSPVAQQLADARYDRSSEAWSRAHTAALNEACTRDPECRELKRRNAEAKQTGADLDERLPLARAAQEAARGPAQDAARASAAAIVHPEYPQLKQAQQHTTAVVELCADIPAEEAPPAAQ